MIFCQIAFFRRKALTRKIRTLFDKNTFFFRAFDMKNDFHVQWKKKHFFWQKHFFRIIHNTPLIRPEKNEKCFFPKKWFSPPKMVFSRIIWPEKIIFHAKWLFCDFVFASKPFFMSIDLPKKSFFGCENTCTTTSVPLALLPLPTSYLSSIL